MFDGERCVQLTLRPSDFIETKQDTLFMEGLADEIASFGRDVVVVFAEDLEVQQLTQTKNNWNRYTYH